MTTDQPKGRRAVGRVGLRVAFPGVWRYMSARYAFDEEAVKRSRETLIAALDRIEAERAGRGLSWSARSSASPISPPPRCSTRWSGRPEFQYELPEPPRWEFLEHHRDHPALAWITETWRRHRGSSAATSLRSPALP